MPLATIDGLAINYRIIGDTGPWIMLTTGARRGHDEFIPLATKLATRGSRVVLHDRRNTGASDVRIEDGPDSDLGEEAIWTRDMHALMTKLGALPAFFGGSSSGARTSILFALRYPQAVRGLLLMRVTGGPVAAARLPENYYGQFIRAAQQGGMAAVCATDQWKERIAANPRTADYLRSLSPETFIAVMSKWKALFEAGSASPVMGVTDAQLASIAAPTIVIPGNDQTHASTNGIAAHERIPGSVLHRLPIEDQDVPLIPFPDWAPYEDEIAKVLAGFISQMTAHARAAE